MSRAIRRTKWAARYIVYFVPSLQNIMQDTFFLDCDPGDRLGVDCVRDHCATTAESAAIRLREATSVRFPLEIIRKIKLRK